MNNTELQQLYDACTGGDIVFTAMYGWYQSDTRDDEEIGLIESLREYEPINLAGTYLETAFEGIIDSLEWKLDDASFYLLDPTFVKLEYINNQWQWVSHYLDLSYLWTDEYASGDFGDCLSYGQLLLNVSCIVDLLWEYNGGAYQDTLRSQLTNLAGWAYLVLTSESHNGSTINISSNIYPNHMTTGFHNGRIRLAAALGYAGCVLDSLSYINAAEYDLFGSVAYGSNPSTGLCSNTIEETTSEGGLYNEGMSYTRYIFNALDFFLTARNRTENSGSGNIVNHNWFTDSSVNIREMYENSLDLISPDLNCIPFDDAHYSQVITTDWNNVPSGAFTRPSSYTNMMTYYFRGNPTSSMQEFIRGFVNRYYDKWGVYTEGYGYRSFYTYNDDRTDLITSGSPQQFLSENDHPLNSEFTILRKTVDTWDDFQEAATLIVNHEHSAGVTSHEHSDQSSFILYYKGKQLLIDPGYRPSWEQYYLGKEWLESPFAHNLILVNPVGENIMNEEQNELLLDYFYVRTNAEYWNDPNDDNTNNYSLDTTDFEPSGELLQTGVAPDPAYKNYLISNRNISHLQVGINYSRSETDITRNFYALDLETDFPYFIIYDEVINENSVQKDFYNQLHYALHPTDRNNAYSNQANNIDDLSVDSYGLFEYHNYYKDDIGDSLSPNNLPYTFLYGVMGSENNAIWTQKDSLPQGLYFGKLWIDHPDSLQPPQWEHKQLRIKTTTTGDEKFLTLLIPSESSSNPVQEIHNSICSYSAKMILNNETSYFNIGDNSTNFNFDGNYYNGNSNFCMVSGSNLTYNIENIELSTIILNNGNYLECHDLTESHECVYFDSDHEFEEMLASYDNEELHVTLKTEQNDYPKYKILRCGVEPENLYSKTEFGTYHHGTIPNTRGTIEDNILSLAYDEDYFYVNYAYSNYVSENLLTENLTILKGTFNDIETSGISVFGLGNITFNGKVTVSESSEIIFPAGFNPTLSTNASFNVFGTVSAIGTDTNKIKFITNSDWDGFYIRSGGEAVFQYCQFENAAYPIRCLGSIDIENCEISNCTNGLYLQACDSYTIRSNEFYECGAYGLLISHLNPLFQADNAIWNNYIHDNNYGIYLFNTNVEIDSNYVYGNVLAGILASSGTTSPILNTCVQNTRDETDNPEIYLVDESYPIIDNRYNDIIFSRGYSFYNADRRVADYYARNNYWGSVEEAAIGNSFYPSTWNVYWDPYLESDTTGFYNSRDISIFDMGLAAEEAGQLYLARQFYLQCIDESDFEVEKVWSASRLLNCVEPENGFTFFDAQQIYESLATDSLNAVLSESAKKYAVNCDRKSQEFQEAIIKYEDMLTDSISTIDSILVQLNIVHTYFESESSSGRTALSFQSQQNSIENHKQARKKETELINMLMQKTQNSGNIPIIDHAVLFANYPNPFNPTTTISFSIPEDSKVRVSIYNVKGQKVKTLVNDELEKGLHKIIWDSKDNSGKSVSSGVYFYKLNVNGKDKAVRKCLLLK
jgi:parallel beta-helix repeat protein